MFNIDELIFDNKLHRFQQQKERTTDETKDKLDTIINLMLSQKQQKQTKQDKFEQHVLILKDVRYKKKWNLLKIDDKTDKIIEFCKTHNIQPQDEMHIIEYQKTKGLTQKDLTYDNVNGKIIEFAAIDNLLKKR